VIRRLLPFLLVFALGLAWYFFGHNRPDTLVVYCAHDSVYAESILREFTRQTGIPVAARYDTEATKSLGLTELLIREKDAPRCDVYWNNELLGTLDLEEKGVLEPYKGPGWERIPAKFRDPEGNWTGFAARLRVGIFNTQKGPPAEQSVPSDPAAEAVPVATWAIAKPLYGTTLTHYSVLWKLRGREKLIAWHRAWRAAGVREVNGNAAVKDAVATGVCAVGFTDTDDFFEAKDAGSPVTMRPVRIDGGATICIPNTVAIIKGTKRGAEARKLVDFLLSAETELALAKSKSRQIPLGPVAAEQLPAEVRELQGWAADGLSLTDLRAARDECLAWLKSEYVP
jgi:iron(III) transport system substrate-binding protein